jgi:ribosomal protein L4
VNTVDKFIARKRIKSAHRRYLTLVGGRIAHPPASLKVYAREVHEMEKAQPADKRSALWRAANDWLASK